MWISRIRVTGGFLAGIDIRLTNGLNVLVGPRGTGKTTLLELLRHAIGAQHAEQSTASKRQRQQFLAAVLGAGEVIVDIQSETIGYHLVVDASGQGQKEELSQTAIVLGQNELGQIASDPMSRLLLLDLRIGDVQPDVDLEQATASTAYLFKHRNRINALREASQGRLHLISERQLLSSQERVLLEQHSGKIMERRDRLHYFENEVLRTGQQLSQIASAYADLNDVMKEQIRVAEMISGTARRASKIGHASDTAKNLADAFLTSNEVTTSLTRAAGSLDAHRADTQSANELARQGAAPIREELERAEMGLGEITAQLRNIDAELRMLDDSDEQERALSAEYDLVSSKRAEYFDAFEVADEARFAARANVARSISEEVSNNVIVIVEHLADSEAFFEFLTETLKGSNTRSSTVRAVADRVLPRQLLEFVEMQDAVGFDSVSQIGADRAQRIIDLLNRSDVLQSLTSTTLADRVDFRLRDGAAEKSVEELSTGQKCAVTLPIILSEHHRTLILDQPEDHLDNEFLVSNVIQGLHRRRERNAQTIIATHNANIPVLGSAENVIVLESDGKRGNIEVQGSFDAEPVVDRITGLMEGGRDAFRVRSEFYASFGSR